VAAPLIRLAAALVPEGARGRGSLELLGTEEILRYFRIMTFQDATTLERLLTPDVAARVALRPDPARYRQLAGEAGTRDYLSILQYVDTHHYMPDDILTKVDRMSMLTSLESRVPLVDHVLLEFVATMPFEPENAWRRRQVHPQADDGATSSPRNHSAAQDGLWVPLAGWFRGALREFAREILLDPRTIARGIVRRQAVEGMLTSHGQGRRDWSSQIWSLICFELWCRVWMDR